MGTVEVMKFSLLLGIAFCAEGSPCSGCGYQDCKIGEEEMCDKNGNPIKKGPQTTSCYRKAYGCDPKTGGLKWTLSRRTALGEEDQFVALDDYELKVGALEEQGAGTNCFG